MSIIRNELILNLERPAFWVLMVLFSANAALWCLSGPALSRGWATNSDFYIARLCGGFSFLTLPFFNAMLMGDPIIRDFRLEVDSLLLSKPVSRASYLLGKFTGSFLTLVICCAGFVLTAFLLQGYQAEKMIVLPWRLAPYIQHFMLLVVVSQLPLAAFCFTVGTLTRNVKLVYGLIIALYVFYFAVMGITGSYWPRWGTLIDPLLFDWVNRVANGRSAAAVNQYLMVYGFDVIVNRLVMIAIAALCLAILYLRFNREQTPMASENPAMAPGFLGLSAKADRLYHEDVVMINSADGSEIGPNRTQAIIPRVTVSTKGGRAGLRQFIAATSMEFRLLAAERSLVVLAPIVMIAGGLFLGSFSGPFDAPLFPLSSIYATNSTGALLIVLFGVTVFFAGEAIHRDRELRVEDLLWSQPAPDWTFLLSKAASLFALAIALIVLSFLTATAGQLIQSVAPVDVGPYLTVYSVILLPSIALMIAAAIALNVLLRNKYLAHAAGVATSGILVYLFQQGYQNWLYNPVLYGLWTYSDMTGLEPYRKGLILHRIYWIAIAVALVTLAHRFFRRGPTRRRGVAVISIAAIIVAVFTGVMMQREIERGPDGRPIEAARIRYEELFADDYRDAPQPQWTRVDLRVELFPSERRLYARGSFKLENRTAVPIDNVIVSLDPTFEWQELGIDGVSRPPRTADLARVFAFDSPLHPGDATTLYAEWRAEIPQGLRRNSAIHTNFIMEGGTLLGGPDFIEWLPMIGYLRKWEIRDEEIRRSYGKEGESRPLDAKGAEGLAAGGGGFPVAPFDLRIEITAPRNQTAVSTGRLVEVRDEGERRAFVYETEAPVTGLAIACAPYVERRRGETAVYYHPGHAFNVEGLLDAMETARRKFERDYGPLPQRDLRFVEFPGLARFAVSYATMIPCSENLVFLSREGAGRINVNYFAASHEIAHQWFGNLVVATGSKGSGVLLEGLAEYAAGALIEEANGSVAARHFRRFEERTYLSNREPDREVPLALADSGDRSSGVLVYQKAALVFHMLETLIGRERMNRALKEYVSIFRGGMRHPTIDDLIAILKRQTPDNSMDRFYDQWFYRVVVPDFGITAASLKREGHEYVVEFTAVNTGEGQTPVTVEAVSGDEADGNQFRIIGVQIVVESGKETKGVIRTPFNPERLVIDRMYDVIDSDRSNNEFRLESSP